MDTINDFTDKVSQDQEETGQIVEKPRKSVAWDSDFQAEKKRK